MPLSSDVRRNKHDPVDSNRVIDSVSSMTRTGKGVGFGASTSSRFGEINSPKPSSPKSLTRPRTSGSMPPSSPVADTKSLSSRKSHDGETVSMYGKERQLDTRMSDHGSRSDPINSKWTASMGLSSKPKPFSSEELEFRRTQPFRGTKTMSAFSPVVIVDEELAAREANGQRPGSRTSSFCNGRRSTPDNWGGGRKGVDSPGPIYVPNETYFRDMAKGEDRNTLSIIMMERETKGLRMSKGQRFTPGMGNFQTMAAPNVSPGPFVYFPQEADKLVLPARTTPATFKPRRLHGSMEYSLSKGNTPSSKYDKVSGASLNTLSVYSTQPALSFGHAARDAPLTGDFVFMSAPPTSKMQRRTYVPKLPGSSGAHAHNQYYSWT